MKVTTYGPAYKRRADGKIHMWKMVVMGNKYRTISGIVDGQKVVSEWTTCTGKNIGRANETTPEGQAHLEANAEYTKKLNQGKYRPKVEDAGVVKFISPMLAHPYAKYEKLVLQKMRTSKVYSQPKLDGVRCIATRQGLFTRQGKPILSAPHIEKAALKILNKYENVEALDGELYSHNLFDDFNKIISLARKTKPTENDLRESEEDLQYHVYDCITKNREGYSLRWKLLRKMIVEQQFIKLVDTVRVNSLLELNDNYCNCAAAGYEGQIIRLNAPYENKRTSSLLKRKDFIDEDFVIVDVIEGKGNRSGMAGALRLITNKKNPKKFTSAIMGTNKYRKQLLADGKKLIGKRATVKFFAYTLDEVPRFPVVKAIRDYE